MPDIFSAHRHGDESITLRPETTAVLVVDMLNDFCTAGGAMVLPGGEVLYGPQNALMDAARLAGMPVAFINDAHRPGLRQDREFDKRTPHCMEGTWGAEVVQELTQGPDDLHITKRRFSGFFNTDLDLTLKDMQIDTVIVAGVVTNVCVRSTVHDAFFQGYKVIVPEDCVAATGPREQISSLYDISNNYGIVSGSAEIINALGGDGVVMNREIAE